jgi:hypothetical protein
MRHEAASGIACAMPATINLSAAGSSAATAPPGTRRTPVRRGTPSHDKIVQAFNTWAFKREQPSDLNALRTFVANAVAREEPVSFVLYWGKGPRRHIASPDLECLDYLSSLSRRVADIYEHGAAITLIFTDTHARLNGHCAESMQAYFGAMEGLARDRGFATCYLQKLTLTADFVTSKELPEAQPSQEVLHKLAACAAKWYRGAGTAHEGALKYYEMNMIERRAVEAAFPNSIFITFNNSEFRCLFPDRLPIFYMYSLRRGVGVKPWFLPHSLSTVGADLVS